jgi:hypothetical protein
MSSGTFATFSKFHLNTSKSTNMKVVQFVEGHNFHVDWHFKFWGEKGENFGQLSSAPVHWNWVAFKVWLRFMQKFAIHHFVHFYSKFWRKLRSNRSSRNEVLLERDVTPAGATGAPAPRRARRTAGPRPHARPPETTACSQAAHSLSTLEVRARRVSLLARARAPVPAWPDRRLPPYVSCTSGRSPFPRSPWRHRVGTKPL